MPYEEIETLLDSGKPEVALLRVEEALREDSCDRPRLYYLQGMAHMKQGAWGDAMGSFRATEAEGPASLWAEAAKGHLQMLSEILEFRHKDLYNP